MLKKSYRNKQLKNKLLMCYRIGNTKLTLKNRLIHAKVTKIFILTMELNTKQILTSVKVNLKIYCPKR